MWHEIGPRLFLLVASGRGPEPLVPRPQPGGLVRE
jgi:hypothetical protein